MKNNWVGHPTFMYDTFSSDIFELNGHWYIQEDWSWGEIWSEYESYGSVLYDLDNKRKISLGCYYVTDDSEWNNWISKNKWEPMDEFEDDMYNEDIEYYLKEIENKKHEKKSYSG